MREKVARVYQRGHISDGLQRLLKSGSCLCQVGVLKWKERSGGNGMKSKEECLGRRSSWFHPIPNCLAAPEPNTRPVPTTSGKRTNQEFTSQRNQPRPCPDRNLVRALNLAKIKTSPYHCHPSEPHQVFKYLQVQNKTNLFMLQMQRAQKHPPH